MRYFDLVGKFARVLPRAGAISSYPYPYSHIFISLFCAWNPLRPEPDLQGAFAG